jgi:hypothetical protein
MLAQGDRIDIARVNPRAQGAGGHLMPQG